MVFFLLFLIVGLKLEMGFWFWAVFVIGLMAYCYEYYREDYDE